MNLIFSVVIWSLVVIADSTCEPSKEDCAWTLVFLIPISLWVVIELLFVPAHVVTVLGVILSRTPNRSELANRRYPR